MTDPSTETGELPTAAVRRRINAAATIGLYRSGAVAARILPRVLTGPAAAQFGLGASFASRERRQMIMRHLGRVDPSLTGAALRRAAAEAFDSYARYWIESFRLPTLDRREVERGLTTSGYREHLVTALGRGRGAILALPHLGGWEWAGRWIADQGHRVTVVVERIEPPELFEWFRALRSDLGMNVVAVGPEAGREVLTALGRNEVVCLLSDRDITRTGVGVRFFGEETTLPSGPALLALRSGAPLLPTAVYFEEPPRDHHLGLVLPPLDTARSSAPLRDDIVRVTQALATALEGLIRRAPTQWHLFQPNWPSDPGYRRGRSVTVPG